MCSRHDTLRVVQIRSSGHLQQVLHLLIYSLLLFIQQLQGKDSESDPLMRAEVGAGVNSDGSPPTSQVWSSNKDLRA